LQVRKPLSGSTKSLFSHRSWAKADRDDEPPIRRAGTRRDEIDAFVAFTALALPAGLPATALAQTDAAPKAGVQSQIQRVQDRQGRGERGGGRARGGEGRSAENRSSEARPAESRGGADRGGRGSNDGERWSRPTPPAAAQPQAQPQDRGQDRDRDRGQQRRPDGAQNGGRSAEGRGSSGWNGGQPRGDQPRGDQPRAEQPRGDQNRDRGNSGWNGSGAQRPDQGRPDQNRGDRNRGAQNRDRDRQDWNRGDTRGSPNWNGGQNNNRGNWNNDRNGRRDYGGFQNRWNQNDWRRDWNRGRSNDWWRNDRGFRGYTGFRSGFYFAPNYGYYAVPRNYWGRTWYAGDYLPSIFWRYSLNDYRTYGLGFPPPGTQWVAVDNAIYLIDSYDGYIVEVIRDAWRW
jgi:hypothetical protein